MNNITQELSKAQIASRKSYLKHKERYVAQAKLNYIKNKEIRKEKSKINAKHWYENNKELCNQRSKEWFQKNKEKTHQRYLANKVRYNKQAKINFQKNKKKIYQKNKLRIANNINLKLTMRLRRSLWGALKITGGKKYCSVTKLIGCSIPELKQHLESLWLPGMNWNNHTRNGWHIDHIKPCSSFNIIDFEEQKLCYHYSNLRPMWSSENISKNSLYNGVRHRYKKPI